MACWDQPRKHLGDRQAPPAGERNTAVEGRLPAARGFRITDNLPAVVDRQRPRVVAAEGADIRHSLAGWIPEEGMTVERLGLRVADNLPAPVDPGALGVATTERPEVAHPSGRRIPAKGPLETDRLPGRTDGSRVVAGEGTRTEAGPSRRRTDRVLALIDPGHRELIMKKRIIMEHE